MYAYLAAASSSRIVPWPGITVTRESRSNERDCGTSKKVVE
ncbi:MAG TPA: hypothetical protein PL078_06225 [Bacillota bacterium]|nr:hypothetical protein [Bacillota bacterium]HPZ43586.1 hypothetical protein [Bacillota bacterium]HQD75986.1 hypothetical protein [Bacillota bacterium]HUM58315.1 hypothetical protein [Bacillota bacterium]